MKIVRIVSLLVTAALAASCAKNGGSQSQSSRSVQTTNYQYFDVKGVVKSIQSDLKSIEIRHEAVTNYMPAMTMPFDVRNTNEVKGLKSGDAVTFRLAVSDNDSWIDRIEKIPSVIMNNPPANAPSPDSTTSANSFSAFHQVPDVEPLEIGDLLPDYHFTNELGQTVSLASLKGAALAITFIFTRCPLPNFCPKMSSNFEETQKIMESTANAPTNWHLLTLSFDPAFDTPAVLKAYSTRFGADPKHWSFLTGDLKDITAISSQFGQLFWQDEGAINHNLRTVVVDASGKVQKIYQGNAWMPEELAHELTTAAKK
jgi:protein SCO1/2